LALLSSLAVKAQGSQDSSQRGPAPLQELKASGGSNDAQSHGGSRPLSEAVWLDGKSSNANITSNLALAKDYETKAATFKSQGEHRDAIENYMKASEYYMYVADGYVELKDKTHASEYFLLAVTAMESLLIEQAAIGESRKSELGREMAKRMRDIHSLYTSNCTSNCTSDGAFLTVGSSHCVGLFTTVVFFLFTLV